MGASNAETVRAIYDDWLDGGTALDKFDPDLAIVESKMIHNWRAEAA